MRPFFICIFLSILLCGCNSRVPEPVNYPYSQQYKMQASHHWNVLAGDLANRINNELILTDNIEKAVFVQETCGDESKPCEQNQSSSFHEAFRDLLITNLVSYGIPTENRKNDEAIDINYKVQIVRHNADRIRTIQPGLFTALSAAIIVLRNAPTDLIILAAGVTADIANANLTDSGNYEVIITTSMVSKGQYLFRASDIYYINDKDFWQYQQTPPTSSTIKLSQKPSPNEERLPDRKNSVLPLPLNENPTVGPENTNNI